MSHQDVGEGQKIYMPSYQNKSCSACQERVNETVKVVKVAKVVKVKVFQVFQNIPGSQLLSDIQTFLAGNQLYELKTHR